MASEKPGSVEQGETNFDEVGGSLLSMENLDRTSPEIWPEKFPGISEFISTYTPATATKMPYSKEFSVEDNNYIHQLASLSTQSLITKVKELHDVAYQLGQEESKEMTRGKYLNIFTKQRREK